MFDFQVRGEEGSERGFHPALADLDRSIDAKGMQPCERFRGLVGRIRNQFGQILHRFLNLLGQIRRMPRGFSTDTRGPADQKLRIFMSSQSSDTGSCEARGPGSIGC